MPLYKWRQLFDISSNPLNIFFVLLISLTSFPFLKFYLNCYSQVRWTYCKKNWEYSLGPIIEFGRKEVEVRIPPETKIHNSGEGPQIGEFFLLDCIETSFLITFLFRMRDKLPVWQEPRFFFVYREEVRKQGGIIPGVRTKFIIDQNLLIYTTDVNNFLFI